MEIGRTGLDKPVRTADSSGVAGQYREITPERRADHVDNLYLLGRLVITLPPPTRYQVKRSFVVMSVATQS